MLVWGVASLLMTVGGSSATPAPSRLTSIIDTARVAAIARDTCHGSTSPIVSDSALAALAIVVRDSVVARPRPKVVQLGDWYYRRLLVHRVVAYATIPVFAMQWAAGDQLYRKGSDAPTWAKSLHRAGATTLAGMFTVNTVTGLWNLWDSRSVPQNRALRTVHALTMLAADGAFTYAGAKLSEEAETSTSKRQLHRTIALSAMGVTVLSGVAMKIWNR
jgi:hypothetical protein